MTTTAPDSIPVHADWTDRQRTRLTGILMFTLAPAHDSRLSAQGKEPQFHITGSTRTEQVTAFNDYGDERFHISGTLDNVARAAADWLGLSTPLNLQLHHEYKNR
ncbi:hypothetical protein [Streptomyces sp. NPDC058371]|uniref:hypothetical protein n=1 Tax=Streptomyces sp. NPDC058371 TaxID=3346463 RepID=UPI00365F2CB5